MNFRPLHDRVLVRRVEAEEKTAGGIIIPAMKARGYPGPFSAAVTSSTATLAIILPPSIPMILYGVAAEVSIGGLFIAGFGPGLLIGGSLMLFVYLYCKRQGWGRTDGDGRLGVLSATRQAAWAAAGVSLPRSSSQQIGVGTRVSWDNLRPGDLMFFYSPISHVGMYAGNGRMVHAVKPGTPVSMVELSGYYQSNFSGATRPG